MARFRDGSSVVSVQMGAQHVRAADRSPESVCDPMALRQRFNAALIYLVHFVSSTASPTFPRACALRSRKPEAISRLPKSERGSAR
jgi:hypothetical protein